VRAFEFAHAAQRLVHGQARQNYPAAQARGPAVASARGRSLAAHARFGWQFAFHGWVFSVFAAFKIESFAQKSMLTAPMRAQPSYIHD